MSKQTDNSRFMVSPLESESIGFYQEILRGLGSYQQLGNRLIKLAEQAHAFRQFDRVKELAQVLINLPIKSYQAIGYYYLAVGFNNCGKGKLDKAKKLFELAADTASPKYQAKAILSLAAVSAHKKDPDAELYYFAETLKASSDIDTRLTALRGMAVHKAREGYHAKALNELERVLPSIKHTSPEVYFSHLNAFAVELGELGRIDEAENVSRLTIASPFAPYYPEWQSTYSKIRSSRKRRSTITVSLPQVQQEPEMIESIEPELLSNVLHFPLAQPTTPDLETVVDTLTTDGIVFTPLQLLGIILKIVLKNKITDTEIDKITTAYYRAIKDMWGE